MLSEHKQLLGTIQDAERQARKLASKGALVDEVVGSLVRLGGAIKERLTYYQRQEAAAPPKAAKQPQPVSQS